MTRTEGERLARMEALIEEALVKRLDDMAEDIKAMRSEQDKDKADLASLKNKGIGLLIGVGLAGGAVGASFTKILAEFFK